MHAITVNDPLNPNEPLIILLALKGITIYFLVRKPKANKYEDKAIPQIYMTSEALVW